ncbi:MAG: hypothetical protein HOQ05_07000 [Corynebacteriales bacterium]|nr:hypothetical protein [Mycobacteriales bacterium]
MRLRSILTGIIALSTVVVAAVFGTAAPAQAATPQGVCGYSYWEVDREVIDDAWTGAKLATTYLMWNGTYNCVVTIAQSYHVSSGSNPWLTAELWTIDGGHRVDEGAYRSYAGPVKLRAPSCVKWWGDAYGNGLWGNTSRGNNWGHC